MTHSPDCTDYPLDGDRRHILRTVGAALVSLGSLGFVVRGVRRGLSRAPPP